MSKNNINCPYCTYLYDEIFLPNGGAPEEKNNKFNCSLVLQASYSFYNNDFLDIADNDFHSFFIELIEENPQQRELIEKYMDSCEKAIDTIEKLYIPTAKDYDDGSYTLFCIKRFLNRDKLFKGRILSPSMEKFYNNTYRCFLGIDKNCPQSYEKVFSVMYDLMIIMNSVAASMAADTDGSDKNSPNPGAIVDLIIGNIDLDAIYRAYGVDLKKMYKLCKNHDFGISLNACNVASKHPMFLLTLFKQLKNDDLDFLCEEANDDPKKLKKLLKLTNDLCNLTFDYWNKGKHYAACTREYYFYKMLDATYTSAVSAHLLEV